VLSEELGRRVIGLDPTFFREEAVDFVGEDQFLELDTLFAKRLDEQDRLMEGHIAIVIAVDEQDRRSPGTDGSHGRRLEGETRSGRIDGNAIGAKLRRPIMHAMKIDAHGK
jgi:hypothetical protein